MTSKKIPADLMIKLRRIKEYLDGEKIGSVISGSQVVYKIGEREFRTRSLFETKKNVAMFQEDAYASTGRR